MANKIIQGVAMTPLLIGLIAALCVFAVSVFLYGIFRKFTQMSWLAWQILVLFIVTLPLAWLPDALLPVWKFTFAVIALLGGVALAVGGGELIRLAMLKKRKPAHSAWRFFNRLLGGLTAVLDLAVIAICVAAFALPVIYYCIPSVKDALGALFESAFWTKFLAVHAFDFVLISVFAIAIRTGWREGFARSVVTILLLVLTIGTVALSIYLTVGTSFFSAAAAWIAREIHTSNGLLAAAIGNTVVFFAIFAVLFALVCVLGFFMVKLIRRIRFNYFWGFCDGAVGALIAFACTLVCVLGLYFAVAWIGGGQATEFIRTAINSVNDALVQAGQAGLPLDGVESVLSSVDAYAAGAAEMLSAPPISGMLFYSLPLFWNVTLV